MILAETTKCRVPTPDAVKLEWLYCTTDPTNAWSIAGDIATWCLVVAAVITLWVSLMQVKKARVDAIREASTSRLIDSGERWMERFFWLGHPLRPDAIENRDRIQDIKTASATLKMHLSIRDTRAAEAFRSLASDIRKIQELEIRVVDMTHQQWSERYGDAEIYWSMSMERSDKRDYGKYRVYVRECVRLVQELIEGQKDIPGLVRRFETARKNLRKEFPDSFAAIRAIESVDGTLGA